MGTCVIYTRLSLARDGSTAAVERQEAECRELAERNGWEVTKVYRDNDRSATSGVQREGFEALLLAKPERVVAWHLDRFLRLSSDLEKVLALDCDIHTVISGDMDLSNPAGRAVARTVVAWASYEVEVKAERQKAGHRQRRLQGRPWWTVRPFGYEKDGSICQEEAKALREAYRAVLDGATLMSIAKEWERKGIRSTKGNAIRSTTLRQMLLHARNIGRVTEDGEEVGNGGWEPLVDDATFRAVARLLGDPKRRSTLDTRRKGLLTGILRCGVCGGRMGVGRVKRYDYYTCRDGGCTSWTRQWIEDFLERRTLLTLQRVKYHEVWEQGEVEDVQPEIDRLESLLEELLQDRVNGVLTREQWLRASAQAQEQLSGLEGQRGALDEAVSTSRTLLDAAKKAQRWEVLPIATKRGVIATVFPEVTLKPYGRWGKPSIELIGYPQNAEKAPPLPLGE